MKRTLIAFYSLLAVATLVLVGCELQSADSFTRNVGVDFTGFYDSTATNVNFVEPANSGSRVTSFNLRQYGDILEAIDNNNYVFRGTLGQVSSDSGSATASFTLEGQTTAGQPVTISGNLSGQGNSATMTGTWIEPGFYAYVNGDATINTITTNTSGTQYTLTVSVNDALKGSVSLSPSGGSYDSGTLVTLTANAATGSTFSSWSVDLTGSANPATITMDSDKNVQANFN